MAMRMPRHVVIMAATISAITTSIVSSGSKIRTIWRIAVDQLDPIAQSDPATAAYRNAPKGSPLSARSWKDDMPLFFVMHSSFFFSRNSIMAFMTQLMQSKKKLHLTSRE